MEKSIGLDNKYIYSYIWKDLLLFYPQGKIATV